MCVEQETGDGFLLASDLPRRYTGPINRAEQTVNETKFRIIGHRGARAVAPDNSERGFAYLLHHGIHWAETDLRINAAGDIVLMHDPHHPDQTAVSDSIHPGLAKLSAILSDHPRLNLNLEIKAPEVMERLCLLPELETNPERFVLSSFHHRTARELKQRFPAIPCLFVIAGSMIDLARYVDEHGMDGVAFEYEFYDEREIRRLLEAGRQVYAFTVNRPRDVEIFRSMGISGIITDDPVGIRDALESQNTPS